MKALKLLVIILLVCGGNLQAQTSEKNLKKHLKFLASDKMKGRDTGSKEIKIAANYIENLFQKYGLTPKGTNGYRQEFEAKFKRRTLADTMRLAENIIGFLDNGAAQTIVVGAHYDHVGLGMFGARDTTKRGEIHNGADDNASGIAGVLELARYYATNDVKENVNFLFIAFSAEELGLLGSYHFVKQPTIELKDVRFMLNMDMIGRFDKEKGLSLIGFGSSDDFETIVSNVPTEIKIKKGMKSKGGSDQAPFFESGIPVLFLHTGGHFDYHKPSDDVKLIAFKEMKMILDYAILLVDEVIRFGPLKYNDTHG